MQKAAAAASGRQFPPTAVQQPVQQQPQQNRVPQPGGMGNNSQGAFPLNASASGPHVNMVPQTMPSVGADPSLMNSMNLYASLQGDQAAPRGQQPAMSQSPVDGRPLISHQTSEIAASGLQTSQVPPRPPSSHASLSLDTALPGPDVDNENKKRKMSEEDDGRRARQKTGQSWLHPVPSQLTGFRSSEPMEGPVSVGR
jgi:hypothetical protein